VKPEIDGDLSFMIFAGGCPNSVIKGFEHKYGVQVTQIPLVSDQDYITKLSDGVSIDLVKSSPYYLPRAIAGGLFQQFNPNDLKNRRYLSSVFRQPYWESSTRLHYGLIYDWGPDGIFYRSDKISNIKHSYKEMFNHPEAQGHIYWTAEQGDTIGMALLANGFSGSSNVPSQIEKATAALLKARSWVAGITDNQTPPIATGDAWLASFWLGSVLFALPQTKDLPTVRAFIPKEGALLGGDTLSIPKIAKHPGTALLFMDWILQPEHSAAIAVAIGGPTGTNAGLRAYYKQVKQHPHAPASLAFPASLAGKKSNWKQPHTAAAATLWNQEWNKITA
jgi:spermidine/putrescine transport system substrate-binding protein